MRVWLLAVAIGAMPAVACSAMTANPAPPREPPIVEVARASGTGRAPPEATACLQPIGWNCYAPTTRKEALEAIAAADLERAREPAKVSHDEPPPKGETKRERKEREQNDTRSELAPKNRAAPELGVLGQYVACHPEDLELGFELARRYAELNQHAMAAYLFLRVGEAPAAEDLALEGYLRGLESLNVIGSYLGHPECYDLFDPSASHQLARLCMPSLVDAHPARAAGCEMLAAIELDVRRLNAQQAELIENATSSSRAH